MVEAIAWLVAGRHPDADRDPAEHHPRSEAPVSRFFGSTFWQAYYVEATILGVVLCIIALRGLEYALGTSTTGGALHYPLRRCSVDPDRPVHQRAGERDHRGGHGQDPDLDGLADHHRRCSRRWAWPGTASWPSSTSGSSATPDGRTALGALQPITVNGEPVDFENIDELDEDAALGVGEVEDFTWKGLLDFSTCTECGRCQSQCPAWNTDKPFSPKLLMMALRDHAHAKAP